MIALLQSEGGKTLDDALSELREAVDYCRYYAAEARRSLVPQTMPGPTGESNELHYRGRGVFVCISPWNFPLAIFLGQVTAALAAGNAVVAKPAEQTPLIAAEAVRLLHQAGVPAGALHLVQGNGKVGAALVADPRVGGVAFTGSTEVGHAINRARAREGGPIAPLIAETGGINAMIVDATALPEQVTDDVITSAFRSAGQRCSALRLLCVQEDVADRMIEMIAGAAKELSLGDPRDPATHIGPVIDDDAKERLDRWIAVKAGRDGDLPLGRGTRAAAARALRAADDDRARPRRRSAGGGVWPRAACGALARRRARQLLDDVAGNGTGSPRHHTRIDSVAETHRAACQRQRLRQPQHDRRGGRHPAVRRRGPVGHRPEGGRAELSPPLRHRADGDDQHRGGGRQCDAAFGKRMIYARLRTTPASRAIGALAANGSGLTPSRQRPGVTPVTRLKARLNAASDS